MPQRMATKLPASKVNAGGITGAFSAVIIYVFDTYIDPRHPLTPAIAAALTTILAYAAAYFTPPAERDQVVKTGPVTSPQPVGKTG